MSQNGGQRTLGTDLLFAGGPILLGAMLNLALSIGAFRLYGETSFGLLTIGLAVGAVLRGTCLAGLDRSVVPTVVALSRRGDRRAIVRLAQKTLAFSLLIGVACSLALWCSRALLAEQLDLGSGGTAVVAIGVATGLSGVCMGIAAGLSLGVGRFRHLVTGRALGVRIAQLVGLGACAGLINAGVAEPSLLQLAAIYVLAEVAGAVVLLVTAVQGIGTSSSSHATPECELGSDDAGLFRHLRVGIPVTAQLVASSFCSDGSKLALAACGVAPGQIASFGIMIQVTGLAALGYPTVIQALNPHCARALSDGRVDIARQDFRTVFLLGALPASALVGLAIVCGANLLRPWGIDDASLATAMIVLAVAQLLDVALGPTGTVLTMAHRAAPLLWSAVGSVAVFVLGSFLFIPNFGLAGAAATIALSRLLRHAWCATWLRTNLGISISPGSLASVLACLGIGLAAAWAASSLTSTWTIVGIVFCAAYLVAVTVVLRGELTRAIQTLGFSRREVSSSRSVEGEGP